MSEYLFQRPAAFIVLEGEDAGDFLQSQCSADLSGLDTQGRDSLWLNHKGKLIGDSRVWRMGEERYGILSWFTPAADLLATIDGHIIADDVEFEDRTEGVVGLWLEGAWPDGLEALWQGEGMGRFARYGLIDAAAEAKVGAQLEADGCSAAEPIELERARIAGGVLRIPADAGADFTPLDAGLEDRVSFTKGCFLGQEVVARMHRLDRHLWHPVRLRAEAPDSDLPPPPIDLSANGQTVGQLGSWVSVSDGHLEALAVVKRKASEPFQSAGKVEWRLADS